MTLTIDLVSVVLNQHALLSEWRVISPKSWCPNTDTQTQVHWTDCCTWTTKMVGNYNS